METNEKICFLSVDWGNWDKWDRGDNRTCGTNETNGTEGANGINCVEMKNFSSPDISKSLPIM